MDEEHNQENEAAFDKTRRQEALEKAYAALSELQNKNPHLVDTIGANPTLLETLAPEIKDRSRMSPHQEEASGPGGVVRGWSVRPTIIDPTKLSTEDLRILQGRLGVNSGLFNTQGQLELTPSALRAATQQLAGYDRAHNLARRLGNVDAAEAASHSSAELKGVLEKVVGLPDVQDAVDRDLRTGDTTELLKMVGMVAPGGRGSGGLKYNYTEGEMGDQALLRMLRSGRKIGQDIPEEAQAHLTSSRDRLMKEMEELSTKFAQTEGVDDKRRISYEMDAKSSLLTQIDTLFKAANKETKSGLEKTVDSITRMAGVLAVGSLASKFIFQDPFRYETAPAINALGRQGELGAAVSGGLMESEQYQLGLNQTIFNAGLGGMGVGLNSALGSFSRGGGIRGALPGLITMGASGALSLLGIDGAGADMLEALNLAKSPEEIIGVNLAQQFLDPNRLVGNWESSRAGLMAVSGNQPNFGYYYGKDAADKIAAGGIATGHEHLDRMMEGNPELMSLGYNGDNLAALLGQSASMFADRSTLTDNTISSARVSGAFGIDDTTVLDMLRSAQTLGSSSQTDTLMRAIGAGADSTGDINTFTVETITKALMETAASLKLQNIARNSDELEKEVFTFRQVLAQSGTPLGDVLEDNPEIFSGLMQTFDSLIKRSLSDPGSMAYDLALGSSTAEIIMGELSVMENRVAQARWLLERHGAVLDGTIEGVTANATLEAMFLQEANLVGVEPAKFISLLALGDDWTPEGVTEIMQGDAEEVVDGRIAQITDSELGQLINDLSDQSSTLTTAVQSTMDDMRLLNQTMLDYIKDGTLLDSVDKSIDLLIAKINQLLGVADATDQGQPAWYDPFFDEGLIPSMGGAPAVSDSATTPPNPLLSTNLYPEAPADPAQGSGYPPPTPEFMEFLRGTYGKELVLNSSGRMDMPLGDQLTYGLGINVDEAFQLFRSNHPHADIRTEYATGGYTGSGGRLDSVGVVHGGEYVVSDNNVAGNRDVLDRIQGGENMSESRRGVSSSEVSSGGDSVELRMRFSGISRDEVYRLATRATEDYVVKNRLGYN